MSTKDLFHVVRQGDFTVVIFATALQIVDEVALQDASRQLSEIAERAVPPWMIMDLSESEYFGSSFVGVLLRVWKRIRSRDDARFAVGGLQRYCREVLEVTQIDRLMPLFATRDEAVIALSAPPDHAR